MKKLDRSVLPEGVQFDRKEGLYAKLGLSGQLLHLGVYENGQRKPGSWTLDVAPDGSWARAEQVILHEWKEDSSESSDTPLTLQEWARGWVDRIADASKDKPLAQGLVCSFCGKTQREVRKLIAGPGICICDECISLCNELIQEELAKEQKQS
jgi:hypothetical protein